MWQKLCVELRALRKRSSLFREPLPGNGSDSGLVMELKKCSGEKRPFIVGRET